jgi:hypothetical protein
MLPAATNPQMAHSPNAGPPIARETLHGRDTLEEASVPLRVVVPGDLHEQ